MGRPRKSMRYERVQIYLSQYDICDFKICASINNMKLSAYMRYLLIGNHFKGVNTHE